MKLNMGKTLKFAGIGALATLLASCTGSISVNTGGQAGPEFDPNGPVTVALLLPSGGDSGALNAIGPDLEKSARLAMKQRGVSNIDLKVYQTGGDAPRAVAKAKEAVAAGAKIILGPLTSDETANVGGAVSVPVISFSNNSEVADANSYVIGTTFENVASRLLKFSKRQGNTKLGIVNSMDLPGEQGAKAIAGAAGKSGVSVVAQGQYPFDIEAIQQVAPQIAAKMRESGADSVFFTDTPGVGGLLYVTTGMAKAGFTSNDAQYIGLSRWNADLEALKDPSIQGGYFAVNDPNATGRFEGAYKAAYGAAPHPIAGLGYDAIVLVATLLDDAKRTGDNTPFSDNDIQRRGGYEGAYGHFVLNGDHLSERSMAVLQVVNGKAVMIAQAE